MVLPCLTKNSVKTRITLSTLAIFLIGIWSLTFYASRILRGNMQRLLGEQQSSTASIIAVEINDRLTDRLRVLETVAEGVSPAILASPATLQTILEHRPILQILFNAGIMVHRLDGDTIAEIPHSAERIGVNYLDAAGIATALKEGKSTVGLPVMDSKLGVPVSIMAVPIHDAQNKVIGALSGATDLRKPNFLDRITRNTYGKTGGYLLIDRQHRQIVAASEKNNVAEYLPAPGSNPGNDGFIRGYTGFAIYDSTLGVEVLSSVKDVPVVDWYVTVMLPTAEAFTPVQDMQSRILWATLLLSMLAAVLTWWMLRRQLSPMLDAAKALAISADSKQLPQLLPIARHDEIGQLIGGFNHLLATLAQREEALKESRQSLTELQNIAGLGNYVLDFPTGLWKSSDVCDRIFGIDEAYERSVEGWLALVHPDDRAMMTDYFSDKLLAKDWSLDKTHRITRHNDQAERWVRTLARLEFDDQGQPLKILCTIQDITELKQEEERTRQLLRENQSILSNAMVGIVYLKHRRIVSCNRRFEEIFKYEPGELLGASTEQLSDTRENFLRLGERNYKSLAETGTCNAESLVRHKDGSLFWGAVSGCAIDPAHPDDGSIWVYADISERRKAEQESAKLLQAIERSPVSITITNLDGVIEYVNLGFTQITGYIRDEVIGQTPRILKSKYTSRATHQELWRTLREGNIWRGILCNQCKNGDMIWADTSISPIFNTADEITNFVAIHEDVTKRKLLEQQLEKHQLELEHIVSQRTAELREALEAAKLADRTKDEFLANITHELRTPLSAVIGMAGLARGISTESRQRDYLDKITTAGKHLNRIINDLLDLSKIAAGHMTFETRTFSLRGLILRGNSVMTHRAAEKGLELVGTLDDAVPDVLLGDEHRLEQILFNLIGNAIKFTPTGRVSVRVSMHAREENRVCLDIEVEDTGVGMRPEDLDRLFKPFSQVDATVSRKYGGTGLGLAISRRLVEMMDGDISVTSREGIGTTFRARLWLGLGDAADLPLVEEEKREQPKVWYQDASILVVDDQPFNRDVVQGLLAAVGISPQLAENGQEAFEIPLGGTQAFDLVLMDIQMPIMDGLTATRAIRKIDGLAQLPIVAMTAHTMTHEIEKTGEAGMNDHIGKPFNEASFYAVLRKWLPHAKQCQQTTAAESPLPVDEFPSLRGIDTCAGLDLLQGDAARYRHWLRDFIAEAPATLLQIRQALNFGQTEPASIAAHTLKGRMGLLGMKELHAIAAALETVIDDAEPADELLLRLEQDVATMCAEIQTVLGDAERGPPVAIPLPDQLPPGLPSASVMQLIASLHAGDSDCDRFIANCLVELKGTAWESRLQQALIHANNFDFAAASRLLSADPQEPAQGDKQWKA
ncbi:MAG: PAS domain S-box protein [Sterolibacterium sp.]|nr:PAS domain S-box protein [Sterolibacterium sp.]